MLAGIAGTFHHHDEQVALIEAGHGNEGVGDATLAGALSGPSGWLCRAVSPRVMQLQGAVNTMPVKTCWSLRKLGYMLYLERALRLK